MRRSSADCGDGAGFAAGRRNFGLGAASAECGTSPVSGGFGAEAGLAPGVEKSRFNWDLGAGDCADGEGVGVVCAARAGLPLSQRPASVGVSEFSSPRAISPSLEHGRG